MAPHASFRFSKMHGAGNDFVVLDLRDNPQLTRRFAVAGLVEASNAAPDLCRALADRRTGAGCDQILTIELPRNADAVASYRIWNSDGSSSQQCGNGARCVAGWLRRNGATASDTTFLLDSPAGSHAVEVLDDTHFRIAMGVPQFAPQVIPLSGFSDAQDQYSIAIVLRPGQDERTEPVQFGAVSMGNPHAVIEVADVDRAPVATIGPLMQQDATFPESANIGFAEVVARDRIRLRVYERGVGETLACGSGACAAVAILARRHRIDREVTVSLPGGELRIVWPDDTAQILMSGPAAFVYEGEWLQ